MYMYYIGLADNVLLCEMAQSIHLHVVICKIFKMQCSGVIRTHAIEMTST